MFDIVSRYVVGCSGMGFRTPADLHYGRAGAARDRRARVLEGASALHPERIVRHPPVPAMLPTVAWMNEPKEVTPDTVIR